MKKFVSSNLFFVLLIINVIYSINQDYYSDCSEGKFGKSCDQKCTCESWSSSNNCSKLAGRCLDCKFGHFGKECENICYPQCKTNLCCDIKSKDFKNSDISIKFNISTLQIKIGNELLNIATDYNVGYYLTIFNKSTNNFYPSGKRDVLKNYTFTKYNVSGYIYNDNKIEIQNLEGDPLKLTVPIILDENITDKNDPKINGVIGLGFLNSINENLFLAKNITLNIASYKVEKETITILFGDLFTQEKKYVHKLSYCDAIYNENKHLSMNCIVEGIRHKSISDALQLNNTRIKFAINEDSSFVLGHEYLDYFKKYYFDDKTDDYKEKKVDDVTYLCFKTQSIHKLSNLGIVINKIYYYFQADTFFIKEDMICKEDSYSLFIVRFHSSNSNIVLGKNFCDGSELTIDNEEKKIYLYSKDEEFFAGEIKSKFESSPKLYSDPMVSSIITVSLIFGLNAISFVIYFLMKKKRKTSDY